MAAGVLGEPAAGEELPGDLGAGHRPGEDLAGEFDPDGRAVGTQVGGFGVQVGGVRVEDVGERAAGFHGALLGRGAAGRTIGRL